MSLMWEGAVAELTALERKMLLTLNKVNGITRELEDAVNRGDQSSVRMLIANRQEPVLELQEITATIRLKRFDLTGEDEARYDEIVVHGGQPENPAEQALADQIATNHRSLEALVTLDRRVNEGICRDKSIYHRTH